MKKRFDHAKRDQTENTAFDELNRIATEDGCLADCFNIFIRVVMEQSQSVCPQIEEEDPAEAAIKQTQYEELIRALRKLRNDSSMKGI